MKRILRIVLAVIVLVIPAIYLAGCFNGNVKKYTVTYNANEGRFSNGSTMITQEVAQGGKLDASLIPTREDFEFSYWMEDCKQIDTNTYVVQKDVTLTAAWELSIKFSENFHSETPFTPYYYILVGQDVDSFDLTNELSCGGKCTWSIENVEGKVVTNLHPGNNFFTILVTSEQHTRTTRNLINVHRIHEVQISYQYKGEKVYVDTVLSGEEYTAKTDVDILSPGYHTSGWKRNGMPVTAFIPFEDTVLEGVSSPNMYTITFDRNGGDEILEDSITIPYGSEFTLPYIQREGYYCTGWYYGEQYLGDIYYNRTIRWETASDATLVAQWDKIRVNVAIKKDLMAAGTITGGGYFDYGEKVTITATINPGYTFLGWYKESNNEFVSNDLEYEFEARNLNLVAKYQKFNLTVSANYGDVIVPETSVVGKPFVLQPALLSLRGFTFDGWYCDGFKVSEDIIYEFSFPKKAAKYVAKWSNPALEIFNLDVNETECKILSLKEGNNPGVLIIPNAVTEIGQYAFRDSTIYKAIIGDGVTTIGECAFLGCYFLVEVTIGSHVTEFVRAPFGNCRKLVEIKNKSNIEVPEVEPLHLYSEGESKLYYDENFIYYIDEDAGLRYLMGYIGSSSTIALPETIEGEPYAVYKHAFRDLDVVEDITIPANVNEIGECAFRGCKNLTAIYYNATHIQYVAWDTFAKASSSDTSKKIKVTIGKNVECIPEYFLAGSGNLDVVEVTFEEGSICTSIGASAFNLLKNLTVITIPESVTTIGEDAYYVCDNIKEIHFLATSCETPSESPFEYVGSRGKGVTLYIGPSVQKIPDRLLYVSHLGTPNIVSCVIEGDLTEIGTYAFAGVTSLTSLTIPKTVTKIGKDAFKNCTGITSFEYNAATLDSDNVLGENIFSGMGITSKFDLTIGADVTYIPDRLFSGRAVKSITFTPNGVCSKIGAYAFANTSAITKLVIPDYITTIHDYAFSGCSALKELTIGTGFKTAGTAIFKGCNALENIYWNAIEAEDGCVFTTIGSATNGATITFGYGVKRIPGYLFSSVANLKFVKCYYLTLEEIGERAFYNVATLYSFTIPQSIKTIGEGAFEGCTGLTSLIYNAEELEDFTSNTTAFRNCGLGTGFELTIGEGVKRIPAYLFGTTDAAKSTRISTVSFAKTSICKEIGDYAFSSISEVKSITVADSVESIGTGAFSNIKKIPTITLGLNLVSLGVDAFKNTMIQEMNWNSKQCQDFSLENPCMQNLSGIEFGPEVIRVPAYIAYNNNISTGIKFTAKGKCTEIGEYAFYGAKTKLVTFYEPLKKIERYAFSKSRLNEVILPDSVTDIGEYAFAQCELMLRLKVSNSVTVIKEGTFQGCFIDTKLINNSTNWYVTLSNTLVEIGDYAFADNIYLKQITLPATLQKIGSYAFSNCREFTSITIPASVRQINAYAFAQSFRIVNAYFEGLDEGYWMTDDHHSISQLNIPSYAAKYLLETYVAYDWYFQKNGYIH